MREHFYRVGLVADERAATEPPFLILDTNIISAFQSLAVNGYDDTKIAHRRSVELLNWIHERGLGQAAVDDSLDLLEGSSIHKGRIDIFNLVRRRVVLRSLVQLGPEELSAFISSGEPLNGTTKLRDESIIREQLKRTETLLQWIFYPAYTVMLAVHVGSRSGDDFQIADEVVRLSSTVPVLPDSSVLATMLLAFGNAEVKALLAAKFFKLSNRASVLKNIQSATWDLALLEYACMMAAVADDAKRLSDQDIPSSGATVIVTDDEALAALASRVVMTSRGRLDLRAPAASISSVHPFPTFYIVARRAIEANIATFRADSGLSFGHFEPSILRYERALGIPASRLNTSLEGVPAESDWPYRLRLLRILHRTNGQIIEFMYDWTNRTDILTPAIGLCLDLIRQNAQARQRSEEDSIVEVLIAGKPTLPGTSLVAAAQKGELGTLVFNSIYRRLAMVDDEFGLVVFTVIRHLSELISDSAVATDQSVESVTDWWIKFAERKASAEIDSLHAEALIDYGREPVTNR